MSLNRQLSLLEGYIKFPLVRIVPFDTVHHDGLLSKLKHYGIDEKIGLWIYNFLKDRKQSVVVDGKQSSLIDVVSGVPQGTVLGPLLFLLHINDLPSIVSSKVRLFADDYLIYRNIKNKEDQIALQKYLNLLENWGNTWGIATMTNSKLLFLRRYLRGCPEKLKQTAYFSLIHTFMEYGATVWDPYQKYNSDKIERVQR